MRITSLGDTKDVQELLSRISVGEWRVQKLTKGHTNSVALATKMNPNDPRYQTKFILKIFSEEQIIDRNKEKLIINTLSNFGLAPKIVLNFDNGMVTEFIEGRDIEDNEMAIHSLEIAKVMRIWHDLVLVESFTKDLINIKNSCCESKLLESCLIPNLKKWYKMATNKILVNLNIETKIFEIEQSLKTKQFSLGFCHNDLLSSNIILKDDKSISFIDFEYGDINYRAFDIANHLVEYSGYGLDYNKIPSIRDIDKFVEVYNLCCDNDLLYKVTVEDVLFFIPITHLFWGLWAFIRKDKDFDFAGYGLKRINRFLETFSPN